MTLELAALLRRDLQRLAQELGAFPDDATLWKIGPGVRNSAGNLTLHLEGNLREYIGRQLGHVPYTRVRPAEFSTTGLTRADLLHRVAELQALIPPIVAGLNEAQIETLSEHHGPVRQFVLHLYGHFNFHLGQIGYLRRMLTAEGAVAFAQL